MTPEAQQLLSLLSILPDGLSDVDLVQSLLPIPNILAGKATLMQTALAFVGQDQHLKVLVPIREHISHTHPPSNDLKLKLREHFHHRLDLWSDFRHFNVTEIYPHISQNLGNFSSFLHDGIESDGPDVVRNCQSILSLNNFYRYGQATYSPLLLQMLKKISSWKDHSIFGEYLTELLHTSHLIGSLDLDSHNMLGARDFPTVITLGTQYFQSKTPLEQGKTLVLFLHPF
jgi:hypothetical protein